MYRQQDLFVNGKTIPVYAVKAVKDGRIPYKEREEASGSEQAAAIFQQYLQDEDRENFVILMVDARNKVIGIHTVSVGSLTAAIVHCREVFKAAILMNAASIICGHNHPSGGLSPSGDDLKITEELVQAGKIIGIQVLDHIIVDTDSGRFHSMRSDSHVTVTW